jgi:carbamoyltransferase
LKGATVVYSLGVSAFYHDSSAALLVDGQIIAAAQEERFTRKKHDPAFPAQAIGFCLAQAGIALSDVDQVIFYDKPFLRFERLLETYLALAPRGFTSFRRAMPVWLREKLFQKSLLIQELKKLAPDVRWADRLLFSEHHLSHAASAYYPSPFDEAVVLTLDGVGEWTTTSAAIGRGGSLQVLREIHFPHSLGLLYSAFTYHAGFRVNSGEYKLMGLAPYGTPRYADLIRQHLIDIKNDGSFRLNQEYFDYCTGLTMTNARFDALFGRPARRADHDPIEVFHMDMAASVQQVTEEVVLRLARSLAAETGIKNLCLAGGVALNCVANGKLLADGSFERLWIQPAAGDAGGALGAALIAYYSHAEAKPRVASSEMDAMQGAYLGPEFSDDEIAECLTDLGACFHRLDEADLIAQTAAALADGQAVGWFQGRMEFGPRALGGRSILADPRGQETQKTLNLKIKFRESFRPFAPSVLREHLGDWFNLDCDSPYMLLVAEVAEKHRHPLGVAEQALQGLDQLGVARSDIPAATHVDYSARVQTVHHTTNPRYHALLSHFHLLTGCPVLVNTSFNVRGEPIVNSPNDAFRCFMGTGLDLLAIGNFLLHKTEQPSALAASYHQSLALD